MRTMNRTAMPAMLTPLLYRSIPLFNRSKESQIDPLLLSLPLFALSDVWHLLIAFRLLASVSGTNNFDPKRAHCVWLAQ